MKRSEPVAECVNSIARFEVRSRKRHRRRNHWSAQTLAGHAILLEIGAELGILDALVRGPVTPSRVAQAVGIPEHFVTAYYAALAQAGLAESTRDKITTYTPTLDLPEAINGAGYLLWGLRSCAPLLSNARVFSNDLVGAAATYSRDGEHVARTSKWIGEQDFYPRAEHEIVTRHPRNIVDLGAGSCRLLMRCLGKLQDARGVGIDMNADACRHAAALLNEAGLQHRVTVVNATIQSLLQNAEPVRDADLIHASFVLHDLLPDEEDTLDDLLRVFRRVAPRATLIVIDAVPFASEIGERSFSAAYTFLHSYFMGRRLLTAEEWTNKLSQAGYESVECDRLNISSGRVFVASAV